MPKVIEVHFEGWWREHKTGATRIKWCQNVKSYPIAIKKKAKRRYFILNILKVIGNLFQKRTMSSVILGKFWAFECHLIERNL